MNNKPKICPYCNQELVIEKDYFLDIIDEYKSPFDLENYRKRDCYNCKNCQLRVGEIKQDKVEWVSKEEAFIRKKIIYEKIYKKYENAKYKKIIPKWLDDVREKMEND